MSTTPITLSEETNAFLDKTAHPLRPEIERLRTLILCAAQDLTEGVKWNAPNYSIGSQDCITLKIFPPKNIQLIFHRGAKLQTQPAERIIEDESGLLVWKDNDRAVLTFNNMETIYQNEDALKCIVEKWVAAVMA